MAKDFVGEELVIGDAVVFMEIAYRNLLLGVVERVTDRKVRIAYQVRGVEDMCMQFHNQVVKVDI